MSTCHWPAHSHDNYIIFQLSFLVSLHDTVIIEIVRCYANSYKVIVFVGRVKVRADCKVLAVELSGSNTVFLHTNSAYTVHTRVLSIFRKLIPQAN